MIITHVVDWQYFVNTCPTTLPIGPQLVSLSHSWGQRKDIEISTSFPFIVPQPPPSPFPCYHAQYHYYPAAPFRIGSMGI